MKSFYLKKKNFVFGSGDWTQGLKHTEPECSHCLQLRPSMRGFTGVAGRACSRNTRDLGGVRGLAVETGRSRTRGRAKMPSCVLDMASGVKMLSCYLFYTLNPWPQKAVSWNVVQTGLKLLGASDHLASISWASRMTDSYHHTLLNLLSRNNSQLSTSTWIIHIFCDLRRTVLPFQSQFIQL